VGCIDSVAWAAFSLVWVGCGVLYGKRAWRLRRRFPSSSRLSELSEDYFFCTWTRALLDLIKQEESPYLVY